MGSSGSGSFSDYSNQKPAASKPNTGGSGKIDKCKIGFATSLEEVSRCQYYTKKGIPPVHTEIDIVFNNVRLVALDRQSNLEIGYLPTKLNYLKTCIDDGYKYSGIVQSNSINPTPYVLIDVVPS